MKKSKVGAFSSWLGRMVANGSFVATGYFWKEHGWLYAVEFLAIFTLLMFALYGLATYPWHGEKADT